MAKKVLVVEKDEQLGKLVSSILEERGILVIKAASAHDALTILSKDTPELIIAGELLSDIDGLGFAARLKDQKNKVPLVFVATSWRDENFYRMLRDDLKVSLIVHRPLRVSVFTAQLLGLLGKDSDEDESIESPLVDKSTALPLVSAIGESTSVAATASFGKLKLRFVKSVPQRLSKLEAHLSAISLSPGDTLSIEHALTVAHNLKGTALSWGFEELGFSSEKLESVLRQSMACKGEKRKKLLLACPELFETIKRHCDLLQWQFGEDEDNVVDELDTSLAKVLVVSDEPPLTNRVHTDSGLKLNFIHARKDEALEVAAQHLLDAALIEIGPQNNSANLARELRDISGYENLPLGFISTPEAADARADAAHAGSSLFLAKPLEPEIVHKVINQLISMREGGRFRVLVVDDDADLSELTCRCLGQFGILTRAVNDPLHVNTVLEEFHPDLILLDVNMPGMSGFELCRNLRSTARWRDVPILFLTAQTDLSSRLTAYEAGADDYLPKPVINVELLTRVKVRLERARELKERSERDLLTGLLLRRAFSDQANALISECSRYDFHFSLCLLDVDYFKKVNDTYGHHAGDEVLSTLGLLLRKRFRVEDLRGRWGGEEFILAFKHENKRVMQIALERILAELAKITFRGENGQEFRVTFSAGIAAFPDEGRNLQDIIKIADKRLYLAKEKGRNQIIMDDF